MPSIFPICLLQAEKYCTGYLNCHSQRLSRIHSNTIASDQSVCMASGYKIVISQTLVLYQIYCTQPLGLWPSGSTCIGKTTQKSGLCTYGNPRVCGYLEAKPRDNVNKWVIAHNTRVGVVYLTYTTLRMRTIYT